MTDLIVTAGQTAIVVALAVAAVTDLRDRLVPDAAAAAVALIGIATTALTSPSTLGYSLAAAALLLLLLLIAARQTIIGGGDAKLLAAVSLAVPLHQIPAVLAAIALAGGVQALLYLAARFKRGGHHHQAAANAEQRRISATLTWMFGREWDRARGRQPIPYAVPVLLGVVWTYLS